MGWLTIFDQIIAALEAGTHKFFHLDGQFVLIEDYIKLRPHKKEVVMNFTKRGKISVGPFYTAVDTALTSGEAIVRNALIGLRKSREWGDPLMMGYLPDIFGHIGQTPQILRGFDIPSAVIGRGTHGRYQSRSYQSTWRSPDGSEVFLYDLANWYCHGAVTLRRVEPHEMENAANQIYNQLRQFSDLDEIFLPYGCDHTPLDPHLDQFLERANAALNHRGVRLIESNWYEFHKKAKEAIHKKQKRVKILQYTDEIKTGSDVNNDLINVLSIHMKEKQANTQNSIFLEKFVEPFGSLFSRLVPDLKLENNSITHAWEMMMMNHAHDSIYGCVVPEVAREVDVRFQKVKNLIEGIFTSSLGNFMQYINFPRTNFSSYSILVVNPLPTIRKDELVTAHVDVYDPKFTHGQFTLLDENFSSVPVMVTKIEKNIYVPQEGDSAGFHLPLRVHLLFCPPQVAPMGYSTYQLKLVPGQSDLAARPQEQTGLSECHLSNEILEVKIHNNGSVILTNKKLGLNITTNTFWSAHDAGHVYQAKFHSIKKSPFTGGSFKLIKTSFYSACVLTTDLTTEPIQVIYFLEDKSSRLDIQVKLTKVERLVNTALGVQFPCFDPSGNYTVKDFFVDKSFEVASRFATWNTYHGQSRFSGCGDDSKNFIVAVRGLPEIRYDGANMDMTLMRNSRMFHDWATWVMDDPTEQDDFVAEFSLMLVANKDQRNAMAESSKFNVPIMATQNLKVPFNPHISNPYFATDYSLITTLFGQTESPSLQMDSDDQPNLDLSPDKLAELQDANVFQPNTNATPVPSSFSFFEMLPANSLVFSTIKKAEERDSLILRFFNPFDGEVDCLLFFSFPVSEVYVVNLAERRLGKREREREQTKPKWEREVDEEVEEKEEPEKLGGSEVARGRNQNLSGKQYFVSLKVGGKKIISLEVV